jgi:cell wall-associated NlpC family hydrolase
MRSHKQLFIIALAPSIAGLLLAGCGALAPAPVVDSKPDTRAASATVGVPAPSAAESPRQTAMRSERAPQMSERSPELLLQALATSGFDYRRGGQSHTSGFDCSGLVAHVFQQAYGVKLPHNSRAQSGYGKPIQVAELEIGDLVFFNTEQPFSHVGIYLGDNRFIHAPKPGAVVRTENITARYWKTRFNGARRILD